MVLILELIVSVILGAKYKGVVERDDYTRNNG